MNKKSKIAVLVSGGVDSAYSLLTLSRQYDVTAFYLKIWNPQYEEDGDSCPWKEDVEYVEKLCKQLNVPLKIVNLQNEYQFTVMEYMISELKVGRTPNPDIFCNYYIKFGAFFDHISFDEYDYVASGHYATKLDKDDDFMYWHSADPVKDQTFFLCKLTPNQIKKIIFPCSGWSKSRIREFARVNNLPQKDRKDSQGLCFIGNINYSEFVSKYIEKNEGYIYDISSGRRLGIHNGLHLYTEGQRHGLNLPNGPWYVYAKDVYKNELYAVNRLDFHKYLTNKISIDIKTLSINDSFYENDGQLYIKVRHPQTELVKGSLMTNSEILFGKKVYRTYIETESNFHPWNYSSGQLIALYQKDDFGVRLIGNATITNEKRYK